MLHTNIFLSNFFGTCLHVVEISAVIFKCMQRTCLKHACKHRKMFLYYEYTLYYTSTYIMYKGGEILYSKLSIYYYNYMLLAYGVLVISN
jgi:hypothetical protein